MPAKGTKRTRTGGRAVPRALRSRLDSKRRSCCHKGCNVCGARSRKTCSPFTRFRRIPVNAETPRSGPRRCLQFHGIARCANRRSAIHRPGLSVTLTGPASPHQTLQAPAATVGNVPPPALDQAHIAQYVGLHQRHTDQNPGGVECAPDIRNRRPSLRPTPPAHHPITCHEVLSQILGLFTRTPRRPGPSRKRCPTSCPPRCK